MAEGTTVTTLASKGEGTFEGLSDVGGDTADGTVVDGGVGCGGETNEGAEHLGETVDLFGQFGAFEFGRLGFLS